MIEVILREDVKTLGKAGELVRVKPGYARNFLLPQGLAYEATEGNKKRIAAETRARGARDQAERAEAERLAATLGAVTLTLTGKAGEEGKLFGSITAQDIAEALGRAGPHGRPAPDRARAPDQDAGRPHRRGPAAPRGPCRGARLGRRGVDRAGDDASGSPTSTGRGSPARSSPPPTGWPPGRDEINRINVFPVPDGDTGTNFSLTLRAVADALRALGDASLPETARTMARAAVLGARGNSGMMLAHFLLGFAESLGDRRQRHARATSRPRSGRAPTGSTHRSTTPARARSSPSPARRPRRPSARRPSRADIGEFMRRLLAEGEPRWPGRPS